MSKLRKNKVGSKSPGKAASSMKIDDLFKLQAEREIKSPSKSDLSTSPYFSPEKRSSFGEGSGDGRRMTKLSRRYKAHTFQEKEKFNQGVDGLLVPKRKIMSDNVTNVTAPNEESKKPKLTLSGDNELEDDEFVSDDDCMVIKPDCDRESSVILTKDNDVNVRQVTNDVVILNNINIPQTEIETIKNANDKVEALQCHQSENVSEDNSDNPAEGAELPSTSGENISHGKPPDKENLNGQTNSDDMDESGDFRIPYYLENFQVILKTVLEDEFYIPLFNEEDLNIVKKFNNLTENGQKLYIRLFQRKFRWLRKDKIAYPKIAEDLSDTLKDLVDAQLIMNEKNMDSLEDVLAALPAPELKQLAKSLRVNASQQMSDLTQAILKHSRQTNISSFFTVKSKEGGNAAMVTKRAKALLGSCYKLSTLERDVFIRMVMLFSLHQIDGDMDDAAGGQGQLYQMLMTKIGGMIYPTYTVNKQTRIFRDRIDVVRFQKAVIMEDDIYEAMDRHQFDAAMDLYKIGYSEWRSIWKDSDVTRHDKDLLEHLRMYTAGSVYARVLTYGVEVLQKKRMYKEAVVLLEELLQQMVYQPSYRGRWYDRLALNLDQHLKQHSKALDVIKEALADKNVRFGHRYSLFQRAQRICNSPSKKNLKNRWKEFMDDMFLTVMEAPTVTIQGKLLTKNAQCTIYVTNENAGDDSEKTLTQRVEDVALAHYKENGYPEGIHGEGGTFGFLLVLFMWSVFYDCDVPDTFLNPYQVFPLDVRTDHFYESRKDEIEKRLEEIRSASSDKLSDMLGESWTKHEGVLSVNWERFQSLEHAQGLVRCVGGPHLAAIIERVIKNMRFTRSGFPDLVVWNPETLKFRISEVKGPGDRLSVKQILWLDYLVNYGMQAETCHVRAVGCKRIQSM